MEGRDGKREGSLACTCSLSLFQRRDFPSYSVFVTVLPPLSCTPPVPAPLRVPKVTGFSQDPTSDLPTTCRLRFPWRHMSSGPMRRLGWLLFLTAAGHGRCRLSGQEWGLKSCRSGEVLGTFRGFQSGASQL